MVFICCIPECVCVYIGYIYMCVFVRMESHGEQVDRHSRIVFTEPETNNQKLVSGQCIHASNVAHRSAGDVKLCSYILQSNHFCVFIGTS